MRNTYMASLKRFGKNKKEHVLGKIGEKNQKWEAANFNIFFADVAEKNQQCWFQLLARATQVKMTHSKLGKNALKRVILSIKKVTN